MTEGAHPQRADVPDALEAQAEALAEQSRGKGDLAAPVGEQRTAEKLFQITGKTGESLAMSLAMSPSSTARCPRSLFILILSLATVTPMVSFLEPQGTISCHQLSAAVPAQAIPQQVRICR